MHSILILYSAELSSMQYLLLDWQSRGHNTKHEHYTTPTSLLIFLHHLRHTLFFVACQYTYSLEHNPSAKCDEFHTQYFLYFTITAKIIWNEFCFHCSFQCSFEVIATLTAGCVCMLVVPLWYDLGWCSQIVVVLRLRRTPAFTSTSLSLSRAFLLNEFLNSAKSLNIQALPRPSTFVKKTAKHMLCACARPHIRAAYTRPRSRNWARGTGEGRGSCMFSTRRQG